MRCKIAKYVTPNLVNNYEIRVKAKEYIFPFIIYNKKLLHVYHGTRKLTIYYLTTAILL